MKVLAMVDGGPSVGYGHLGRTIALCSALEKRGHSVAVSTPARDYVQNHGLSWEPLASMPHEDLDWVVIDRAEMTSADRVRSLFPGARVCLIDDVGDARSIANITVDPPTRIHWPAPRGESLRGPQFVLLRSEFGERALFPRERGPVLVTLGGADPLVVSPSVADELLGRGFEVVVVEGPAFRRQLPPHLERIRQPERMSDVLAQASLVVCGYGHTLFEAARMGVPSVFICWNREQVTNREGVQALGFALYGGHANSAGTPRRVVDQVSSVSGRNWKRMSDRAMECVDGLGTCRVATAIEDLS